MIWFTESKTGRTICVSKTEEMRRLGSSPFVESHMLFRVRRQRRYARRFGWGAFALLPISFYCGSKPACVKARSRFKPKRKECA